MKRIDIDFAPASLPRAVWRLKPLALASGIAGVLLCASAAIAALDMTRQRDLLQAERQQASDKLAKHRKDTQPVQKAMISEAQAKALNGAISQLNLPWREVLNALERATPSSIALLSLEPDGTKFLVKGWAEAKAADDMLSYIELLKEQKFFDDATLIKHEVNEQDANKPFRFQFEAHWAGAAS